MIAVNQRLIREAGAAGAAISKIYFCPHTAADNCSCRKPNPGLVHRALRDFGARVENCVFVGDSTVDVDAGRAAGCATVQVGGARRAWPISPLRIYRCRRLDIGPAWETMMVSFDQSLADALATFTGVAAHAAAIEEAAALCTKLLETAGGRILVCGNGGSACEAQHLAGELVGRSIAGSSRSCCHRSHCRWFRSLLYQQRLLLRRRLFPPDRSPRPSRRSPDRIYHHGASKYRPRPHHRPQPAAQIHRFSRSRWWPLPPPHRPSHRHCTQQTARIQEAHQFLLHCLMDRIEHRLGFA